MDRWISPEAEVISYPPIPNEQSEAHAEMLFSGVSHGVRAPNPEIPGGHIAHIATNNNGVQTPPNSLDRMHACPQKQVAFNQRILKSEEEVAGISADLADFPLFACVNVGGRMLGTQPMCGQLWTQKDRQVSATCFHMEGLGNSREEVALSKVVDLSSWRDSLETTQGPDDLQLGQRVVVYPKFLEHIKNIFATGTLDQT
jgi:hypothetical protein